MDSTDPNRSPAPPNRRAPGRQPDPFCPACTSSHMLVTLRAANGIYYRCEACGHLLAMMAIKQSTEQ